MAHPDPSDTAEEYLALERRAETRSEFLGGEIFAMASLGVDLPVSEVYAKVSWDEAAASLAAVD